MTPARAGRRPVVLWFRRDLRLSDHPALGEAAQQGPITALFVLDDVLLRTAGKPRLAYLLRTLRALEQELRALGGALTVRRGPPRARGSRGCRGGERDRGSHHCRLRALWHRARSARRSGARHGAAPGDRLAVRGRSHETPETRWSSVSGVHALLPSVACARVGAPRAPRSRFDPVVPTRRCAHPRRSRDKRDLAGCR